jgi:hypothetical protein
MGYDGITQLKIFAALTSTALALALDALPLVPQASLRLHMRSYIFSAMAVTA